MAYGRDPGIGGHTELPEITTLLRLAEGSLIPSSRRNTCCASSIGKDRSTARGSVSRTGPSSISVQRGRPRKRASSIADHYFLAGLHSFSGHRGAKRVRPASARIDADGEGALSDEEADGFRGQPGRAVGAHPPEERSVELGAVPGRNEVRAVASERMRMDGQEPGLAALAEDLEVADAAAVVNVADVEMAELGAAQAVVQERRSATGKPARCSKSASGGTSERRRKAGSPIAGAETRRGSIASFTPPIVPHSLVKTPFLASEMEPPTGESCCHHIVVL